MVKIANPLMSEEASGSIGKGLTFSNRKSGQQARYQKKQKNVTNISTTQTEQRRIYLNGAEKWSNLSQAEKNNFIAEILGQHLTGYNIFMKDYLLLWPYGTYGIAIFGYSIYGNYE